KPIQVAAFDPASVTTLQVQSVLTEDVTVAAGAAPSVRATPGAALTMVTARDIAQRTPANLMQAVESVPGVNQVSEGQAAVPAVRGLARGRTLIMIDGGRVSSERRVGPSATFMDPAVVEGIDVARGPGSVAYGSDAFGGVISARTLRPAYSGVHFSGSGTLGAGIPDRLGDFTIGKGFGSGGVIAAVHGRSADDYDGPDGEVLNSGWSDRGVLLRGDRRAGQGLFSASWQSDFGDDIERPRNNSNAVRFYYPFENSHRFNASYEVMDVARLDVVSLTAFFGSIEQRTDQDRFPTPARPREIERADVSAKDFEIRAMGEKTVGATELEFGVHFNGRYDLEAHDIFVQYDADGSIASTRDNESVESARRIDSAFFAQASTPLGSAVTATGGVRFDHVGNKNVGGFFGDRSISNSAVAGFAAISAVLSNVTVTGQVARGFRDPTLSDRFFRGPSGRGFITGNPDLDPETSLQYDLGARYSTGAVRFGTYYYHYTIHDLVERYQPEPDFFFFRNRGEARIQGVEFEVQASLPRSFGLEAGAQISRGTLKDDDTDLDDISPDSMFLLVRKSFFEKLSTFARVAFYAEDNRPGPSEIAAPGHTNIDIGASWALTRNVELRGAINNLLDDDYYASPDPRFVPAPGINAFLTFAVKY
ncbi:MAG TPA: TonB-dependent receptor, partial [Vicinamibacterales bacterium]|nr:TonB-dependent receptor [Vicinamibacterales bacterium]